MTNKQKCTEPLFQQAIDTCRRKVGHAFHDDIHYGFCLGNEHARMQAQNYENNRGSCMMEAARFRPSAAGHQQHPAPPRTARFMSPSPTQNTVKEERKK
jgi:hypothetical protein